MNWLLSLIALQCFAEDSAPVFTVNLDSPPASRWTEIILAKRPAILKTLTHIENEMDSFYIELLKQFIQLGTVPSEYLQEMQGIAQTLSVSPQLILLVNYIYELFAGCTSIIARNTENELFLARNLDYAPLNEFLPELAIQVNFYKNNTLSYQSVGFAGMVGVVTGLKPGKFGIALNERNVGGSTAANALALLSGSTSAPLAARYALEHLVSYKEAATYLQTEQLISQVYFAVAGVKDNEGMIITRNLEYAADIWELSQTTWFLVETNYDHWVPTDERDDRVHPAIHTMERLKGDFTASELYEVLSEPPVLNNWTIYTTVLSVSTGALKQQLRS